MYKGKALPTKQEQQELIRRARECDPSAFAKIYEYYYEDIYNYIYCRVSDAHVAEDLTAEVFLKVLESIDSFTFRGIPFFVWLVRIARNLVIDYFRKKPTMPIEVALEEEMPAAEAGVDEVFDQELTQQQLTRALSNLTEDQQEVIILRFVDGFSVTDVAQALSKSEGAIKALQHRGLSSLSRIWKNVSPDGS